MKRLMKISEAEIIVKPENISHESADNSDDNTNDFKKFDIEHPDADYNDWFAFFQKRNAQELIESNDWLARELPSDGYAAYKRWLDIFENPSKMEKIAKAKMEDKVKNDMEELAVGDDDEKYYEGIIREMSRQMNSNSVSPQEFARLSSNMLVARKELREIRSRKPKQGSVLERVLDRANNPTKKTAKSKKSVKTTPVKKRATAPKAAGVTKAKKTVKVSSKGKK